MHCLSTQNPHKFLYSEITKSINGAFFAKEKKKKSNTAT